MENEKTNTLLKSIVLAASWLTLSPLMLILDGHWKLLPKWLRIMLFVLSPMMLIIMAVAAFWSYGYYSEHYMQHHFVKRRVVENITGVRLPRYKLVDRGEERKCFGRFPDHTYDFTLEFKKMPDDAFYENLDKHFDCFEPGKYSTAPSGATEWKPPKENLPRMTLAFPLISKKDQRHFILGFGDGDN